MTAHATQLHVQALVDPKKCLGAFGGVWGRARGPTWPFLFSNVVMLFLHAGGPRLQFGPCFDGLIVVIDHHIISKELGPN